MKGAVENFIKLAPLLGTGCVWYRSFVLFRCNPRHNHWPKVVLLLEKTKKDPDSPLSDAFTAPARSSNQIINEGLGAGTLVILWTRNKHTGKKNRIQDTQDRWHV